MIIAVCQRGFLNLCEVFHIQLQWQRKWSKRSKNPHKHGIYRLLPPPKPICTPLWPPLLKSYYCIKGIVARQKWKEAADITAVREKELSSGKKTYSMALADTITGGRGPEVQTDVLPKAKFTVRAPCAGVKAMTIPPSGTNGRWE